MVRWFELSGLAVAVGLVLSGAARAEGCDMSGSMASMRICSAKAVEVADQHLNAVYQEAIGLTTAWDRANPPPSAGKTGAEARLRTAQRAWIAFRDADCDAKAYTAEGGSIQGLILSDCLLGQTKLRVDQLKALAEAYRPM